MLLFQKRFWEGIVLGSVNLTFRFWDKPHVKPTGRYRVHPIGVVEVEAISRVTVGEISDDDARRAGFASRSELLEYMKPAAKVAFTDATPVFRIAFHHGGEEDRVPLALEAQLSPADVAEIKKRLARLDQAAAKRWTMKTLKLISERPRIAASKLARSQRRETEPFKVDVRKLKRLGLTQSLEVGYELSPRGRAFLQASHAKLGRRCRGATSSKSRR